MLVMILIILGASAAMPLIFYEQIGFDAIFCLDLLKEHAKFHANGLGDVVPASLNASYICFPFGHVISLTRSQLRPVSKKANRQCALKHKLVCDQE